MQIEPMLALQKPTLPFDDPNWLFEIKWNGERVVADVEHEKICKLFNRKGKDISRRFPEIIGIHVRANQGKIDGEVVCFDERGIPSFNLLQHRISLQNDSKIPLAMKLYPCHCAVFDVMELETKSLIALPITERKEILNSIANKDDGVIPSMYIIGRGVTFYDLVIEMGHEGVMAKKINSPYIPGSGEPPKRSNYWLKIKPRKKTVCEITGFNKGEGHRERMGALLISEGGIDRGRVGSGLKDSDIDELLTNLGVITRNNGTTIVKPTIHVEVNYFEVSKEGHFIWPSVRKIII